MIKHLRRHVRLTLMMCIAALTIFAAIPLHAQTPPTATATVILQPTETAQVPPMVATTQPAQPTATAQTPPTTPAPTAVPTTAVPVTGTPATATPQPTTTAPTPQTIGTQTGTPQAQATVSVDGSKIVSPILKAAATAYATKQPDVKVDVNVSGTSGGFEKFCNGTLDINMAVTPITDAVAAACQAKNINYVELLLGYDALVIAVNKASPITCLTSDQLNKLLSPTSSNTKNWKDLDSTLNDSPISGIFTTKPDTQAYVLADSIINGEGLRADLQFLDTEDAVGNKAAGDANAVGVMSLRAYTQNSSKNSNTLKSVQLKQDVNGTCVDATVPDMDEGRYLAAEPLFLYVNAASLDRKPVKDFVTYVVSTDSRLAITDIGFTAASDTDYDRDLSYVNNKQTGRKFSLIQNVNVPPGTAGTIVADGSATVFQILKSVADSFKPRYANITLTNTAEGNAAGYQKLCAPDPDPTKTVVIAGSTRLPTDDEAAACQKANIQTLRLTLGSQGIVLLVNANNKFAMCLTTDQLAKIFSSESAGKVMKWSDVDPSFSATDLLILTPSDGALETDLLLNKIVKGAVAPIRRNDVTDNSDALYRAAATANVEGAITYMTYADYQKVKSNVHTVQVNSGSGCQDPSEANIKSGAYPISQTLYLTLSVNAFARLEVKAFIWYLLSDDALTVIQKENLIGTDAAGFAAARSVALEKFAATGGTTIPTGTPGASGTPGTPAPTSSTPVGSGTAAASPAAPTSNVTQGPTAGLTTAPTSAPTTAPTTVPTTAPTAVPPTPTATGTA